MDLGLKDRVYIVTGGSRGLGHASAKALVAEGARVVVAARSADAVAKVVAAFGDDRAVGVPADNADHETPQRLITAAHDHFGRLDGALISVGGPPPGSVADLADEQWRSAFESVFLGAVRLARTIASTLEPGGSLAFVLSGSVRSPIPGLTASNGLRPGLAMVVKELADTLGPKGIRSVGLLPGSIDTGRLREIAVLAGQNPEDQEAAISATIPLRRYGQPEEFGRVAAFVLSPAASYISGSMIPVDGGVFRTL